MPSGIPLSTEAKQFIYHCRMVKNMTCSDILDEVLDIQLASIGLSTVYAVCNYFDNHNFIESSDYIQRKSVKHSRAPCRLNDAEIYYLISIVIDSPSLRTKSLCKKFARDFYDNPEDGPSISTVRRCLLSSNFTRKVLERRHVRQDPILRFEVRINFCDGNSDKLVAVCSKDGNI